MVVGRRGGSVETMPVNRAACAAAFSHRGTVLLLARHGHQSQVQQAVLSSRKGEGCRGLSLTKMHGMRWKVNSDLETKERRNMKGDGLLKAETNKNKRNDLQVSSLHCLRCTFVLLIGFTSA